MHSPDRSHTFKRGDFVYLHDSNGSRINATVRKASPARVTIKAFFPDGGRVISVLPQVLTPQQLPLW